MPQLISDVDVVFHDLVDSLRELEDGRPSPVRVRRAFTRFVNLCQQLTAAMRAEYKEQTGRDWNARAYGGWTAVTDLFKRLRNIDQHQAAVQILVRERQSVRPFPDSRAAVVFEGTWELHDQLAEYPPEGLQALEADPEKGGPSDRVIQPSTREFTFLLHPRTPEIADLIRDAGCDDLHLLARQCIETLSDYMTFYRRALTT